MHLMMERSEELLAGIQMLMKGLGVEKAILGIENNKPDAIEKMKKLTEGNAIKVQGLKVKYPQGGEKQLVQAFLNVRFHRADFPLMWEWWYLMWELPLLPMKQ